MSKLKDLVGKKFGSLVVLKRESNDRYSNAMWKCICECGKETIVAGRSLSNGNTKSCGCKENRFVNKDYSGMRSGFLVAICATNEKTGNAYKWKFKCDCGKIHICLPGNVFAKTRPVQSCGCMKTKLYADKVKTLNLLNGSFKGVRKNGKGFSARVSISGKLISLGTFETDTEAAKAYDDAIKKRDGIDAALNFPDMSEFEE